MKPFIKVLNGGWYRVVGYNKHGREYTYSKARNLKKANSQLKAIQDRYYIDNKPRRKYEVR